MSGAARARAVLASRRVQRLSALVLLLVCARVVLGLSGLRYRLSEPLAEFTLEQVARMTLTRPGQPELVLERVSHEEGGGWVVTSHGALPAHDRVDGLLQRIRSWRRERVAGDDPSAHVEWQVDEAKTRELRLEDAKGEVLADLLIGGIAGVEGEDVREQGYALDTETLGLFVRPKGEDRVYVVTEFITGELEPDPVRWYRQPALQLDPAALRSVGVARGGERVQVGLQPGPHLVGDPRPVDPLRLQGLLRALGTMEIRGPAEGQPPEDAITFQLDPLRGDPFGLAVWRRGEQTFLASAGRVVEIGRLSGQRLGELQPGDLVLRRWCLLPAQQVRAIELLRPDGVDRLERQPNGRWVYERVVEGVARTVEVEDAKIQPFVHALAGLEVSAWAPLPEGTTLGYRLSLRDRHGQSAGLRFGPNGTALWAGQVEGVAMGARVDGTVLGGVLDRLARLNP